MKVFLNEPQDVTWVNKVEVVDKVEESEVVLFSGQGDIYPEIYGCRNDGLSKFSKKNDIRDIKLFAKAKKFGIPCFGIDRGYLLLGALSGSSIIQDMKHPDRHRVTIGSKTIEVVSDHHQLLYPHVNIPAKDFIAIGRSEAKSLTPYLYSLGNRTRITEDVEIIYFKRTDSLCCLFYATNKDAIELMNGLLNSLVKGKIASDYKVSPTTQTGSTSFDEYITHIHSLTTTLSETGTAYFVQACYGPFTNFWFWQEGTQIRLSTRRVEVPTNSTILKIKTLNSNYDTIDPRAPEIYELMRQTYALVPSTRPRIYYYDNGGVKLFFWEDRQKIEFDPILMAGFEIVDCNRNGAGQYEAPSVTAAWNRISANNYVIFYNVYKGGVRLFSYTLNMNTGQVQLPGENVFHSEACRIELNQQFSPVGHVTMLDQFMVALDLYFHSQASLEDNRI